MVIDKRTTFLIKLAQNLASITNEKERTEALSRVPEDIRKSVESTALAMGQRNGTA